MAVKKVIKKIKKAVRKVSPKRKKAPAKKAPKRVNERVTVQVPCPDCMVLVAEGGASEFKSPRAGLINPSTSCPNCEGSGSVKKRVKA